MFAAYAPAKAALVRFTEIVAIERARDGIRINAVALSAFVLGMTRAVRSSAEIAGEIEAAIAKRLLETQDTVNAEKAARFVVYLTIGKGRDVTGKLISAVCDRWDCLHRYPEVLAHKDVFTHDRVDILRLHGIANSRAPTGSANSTARALERSTASVIR